MNATATISCSCGCLFAVSFQKSSASDTPKCPQCQLKMSADSWKALRTTLSELADFNTHILKWNSEYNEPKMLVPAITVHTFED